jgi:hypothetical protein
MKLSEFKSQLNTVSELNFVQPNGVLVPSHFHITEAGLTTKHFIDCGGTVRTEKTISFQVWVANDTNHKLEPSKLQKIIGLSESLFNNEDLDIEVEYQADTIGRYGVDFNGEQFILTPKETNCLAKDHCGIPPEKMKLNLSEVQTSASSCCAPNGGCC